MSKIRISKVFEKVDASGRLWFNQAITIDQFPHDNFVVWERSLDMKYMREAGVYDADIYLTKNEYQAKDGRTVKETKVRFANLKSIQTDAE